MHLSLLPGSLSDMGHMECGVQSKLVALQFAKNLTMLCSDGVTIPHIWSKLAKLYTRSIAPIGQSDASYLHVDVPEKIECMCSRELGKQPRQKTINFKQAQRDILVQTSQSGGTC